MWFFMPGMRSSQRAIGIDNLNRAQSGSSTYKSHERGQPVSPLLCCKNTFRQHTQLKPQSATNIRSDILHPWHRHIHSPCRRMAPGSSCSSSKVGEVTIITPPRCFTSLPVFQVQLREWNVAAARLPPQSGYAPRPLPEPRLVIPGLFFDYSSPDGPQRFITEAQVSVFLLVYSPHKVPCSMRHS